MDSAEDSSNSEFPDSHDACDIESSLSSFHSCVTEFSDSHNSWLSKQEFEKEINKISEWVEEQKKESENKLTKEHVQNVCNIATFSTNAILKIISSAVTCVGAAVGGPIGEAGGTIIGTICNIIGAIFTANEPEQPSVVEQLAKVVHQELVDFNKKLQYQKYHGLVDRVSEQKTQLRTMEHGDDLADPNLWHDYVQFLGELASRFESPVPFKYENNLTKDPDVADCVTAIETYCQAYNCFMAILISAKGRFSHLKERRSRMKTVDLIISNQIEAGKMKLGFLSDEKYLTFLGRLPYEGGKLTKIVALSRDSEARRKLELVTRGLGLPRFPDFATVESKAKHVSGLSVKVPVPAERDFTSGYGVKFTNKTKFPMKVVCASAGNCSNNLEFTEVVQPDYSIQKEITCWFTITVNGYILLYLDGNARSDDNPCSADKTRVMEFALSWPRGGQPKINIQDKTGSEFTKGEDTYDKLQDGEKKTVYWLTNDTHHMACGDFFKQRKRVPRGNFEVTVVECLWQFIVQNYDPSQL